MSYVCQIVLDHCVFFFNDTATTEIYTLSLHDALPIWTNPDGNSEIFVATRTESGSGDQTFAFTQATTTTDEPPNSRSEEHTSELQSRQYLVCRLLLEKKKKTTPLITKSSHTHYTTIYE